jgi:hypothetical protein
MIASTRRASRLSPSAAGWLCASFFFLAAARAKIVATDHAVDQSGSTQPTGQRGSTECTTTLPLSAG